MIYVSLCSVLVSERTYKCSYVLRLNLEFTIASEKAFQQLKEKKKTDYSSLYFFVVFFNYQVKIRGKFLFVCLQKIVFWS